MCVVYAIHALTCCCLASFSDKTQYKYFFRTIATQTIFGDAMMGFATTQGWSKIGIVYTDDPTGQQCE